jgi:ATP-dependent RNA helicase RhlE
MSFDTLGLAPEFLRAVADQGYTEPTPVQSEAIPLVLAGRDLMAGAQTGTGKTAAFVMPMLQRLGRPDAPGGDGRPSPDHRPVRRPIRGLVLAPTRELALQVEESVRVYGRQWGVRSAAIYGGVGFGPQVNAIRRGVDVVVATPGRLLDHVGQRTIDLSRVEILVLDEADRMLDMGFIRDIRRVLEVLPPRRQNLLFSATFSDEIRSLASGFLREPASVQVTPRNSAAPLVTQVVHPVDRERKRELLSHLIRTGVIDQALVFTRTKHGANRLAQQLERDGIAAVAIHGNKSQGQRVRALADFKTGRTPILVATEIAARGLDIDGLPHVVNFELPMVPEDYVHRIGRTGRAGSPGHAVSLVCVDEQKLLRDIERVLGRPVTQEVVPGFEPDRTIRAEPILRGGLGRGRPAAAGSSPMRGRSAPHPRSGAQFAAPRHGRAMAPHGARPAHRGDGVGLGETRPGHGEPGVRSNQPSGRPGQTGQRRAGGQPRHAEQTRTGGQPRTGGQHRAGGRRPTRSANAALAAPGTGIGNAPVRRPNGFGPDPRPNGRSAHGKALEPASRPHGGHPVMPGERMHRADRSR